MATKIVPIVSILASLLLAPYANAQETPTPTPSRAALDELAVQQQQIASKKEEIAKLEQEINSLKNKRDTTAAEAKLIDAQVKALATKLEQAELELGQTKLRLKKVSTEQASTEEQIDAIEQEVTEKRGILKGFLRLLYEQEQNSFVEVFLGSGTLGEALAQQSAYEELQKQTKDVINGLKETQEELLAKKNELEQQEQDLSSLTQLLSAQQNDIAQQKKTQQQFLSQKEAEKTVFEQKIAEAQEARKEIEQSIFTLKDAGVKVSLNNAIDMARYAGKLTGVRPALLMGVLKIESNVGTNIGSGKFPDDMHPQSREPFLRITKELGLDPYTAQISRRPASGKGWGGAMGPGQIMPATWESIQPRLKALTGKELVSPYELADAFVATAIFLADRGATDPSKEYEAVNRYIAGPNWQYYTWYGDKVLAVAKEYEAELSK